ncbi:hypothetical protein BpHYR1_011650 [Brachionus plicatilis]|uniref:Uncharacterized protein n=1 Tax=Brachionus plicatilis TaxID=10195 RepID=A0A3M7PCX7_BRAPC|nr:hypothetical protein BpHYR1_011650 [Brachionus plicatilis]
MFIKKNLIAHKLVLGTVQTAIDAAKNFLNNEQDRRRNLRSNHISEKNFLKKNVARSFLRVRFMT